MIVITGANGHLGRHVVQHLAAKVDPSQVVATARRPETLDDLSGSGLQVRHLDYDAPDTISAALDGAQQVLLISSSAIGVRVPQHQAVIDAAVTAGVEHLAYTSVLSADTSGLMAAQEHKATEALLAAADLTTTRLRNGWYQENYTENLEPVLGAGAVIGSAGNGKVGAAARTDYAAAAAAVLADPTRWGGTYELAGPAFTMADYAALVAAASGKDIGYVDMPSDAYIAALTGAGLPEPLAGFLADSDLGIGRGELEGDPSTLQELVGGELTTIEQSIAAALA